MGGRGRNRRRGVSGRGERRLGVWVSPEEYRFGFWCIQCYAWCDSEYLFARQSHGWPRSSSTNGSGMSMAGFCWLRCISHCVPLFCRQARDASRRGWFWFSGRRLFTYSAQCWLRQWVRVLRQFWWLLDEISISLSESGLRELGMHWSSAHCRCFCLVHAFST